VQNDSIYYIQQTIFFQKEKGKKNGQNDPISTIYSKRDLLYRAKETRQERAGSYGEQQRGCRKRERERVKQRDQAGWERAVSYREQQWER
jgi:hypothetical protein